MSAKILVVDDEPDVRTSMARMLRSLGHEVEMAPSGVRALEMFDDVGPDLVVTDLRMPHMDGLELLAKLRERRPDLPVVMVSGEGTISDAVEATRLGAIDFLEKPARPERLEVTIGNALRIGRLGQANRELKERLGEDRRLLGESRSMVELRSLIAKVAPTEGRVLILGENGTGKELVAEAIHAGSPRANGAFVKLNCSAVPRELIESELFGHEKGAFTGAVSSRRGRFEMADGGTLFLDEVGDMPPEMQTKLLRVMQEGELERVGGTRTIKVDVRLVAATNRQLAKMVEEGAFREDLYYRLNVVTLRTPSLRERLDDLPLLLEVFTDRAARRHGSVPIRFSSAALEELRKHDFPGNVRELQNLVERLSILSSGDIGREEIRAALEGGPQAGRQEGERLYRPGMTFAELVGEAERKILTEAISLHENNKSAAARALGLERSHFYKKCKQVGVETE